jgi:glutamate-ammonia-ligase adenylyltransferase
MLRDEGTAAQRLARVLSSSRYAVELLIRSPEAVSLLGDSTGLVPPEREALAARMRAAVTRQTGAEEAFQAVRRVRARELVRIVLGDLVGDWSGEQVRGALTEVTDAYLSCALEVATREVLERRGEDPATDVLVVGMGRLGGRELGYASDADVMYVHDPVPGADPETAAGQAGDIVSELRKGLSGAGPDPTLELDADLRPEGRSGPLVRSLEGYATYYERWSAGWESQALLRARPVAGDDGLAERFVDLVRPLRWPEGGIDERAVREIRRLKARMESERLPRGADPRTHLKLGLGGLSDVEWVIQLLQLRHAHVHVGLRTTSTGEGLDAAVAAGLLAPADAAPLAAAWQLASQIRDAGVVWRGRAVDSVPSDLRDAEGMSRIMGRAPGEGHRLADDWRRVARHARTVVERLLYGDAPPRAGARGEPAVRTLAATTLERPRPGRAAGFRRDTSLVTPPRDPARFPRRRPGVPGGSRPAGDGPAAAEGGDGAPGKDRPPDTPG